MIQRELGLLKLVWQFQHVAAFSQVREPAASLVAEGMNKESLLICNSQNWIIISTEFLVRSHLMRLSDELEIHRFNHYSDLPQNRHQLGNISLYQPTLSCLKEIHRLH